MLGGLAATLGRVMYRGQGGLVAMLNTSVVCGSLFFYVVGAGWLVVPWILIRLCPEFISYSFLKQLFACG